MDSISRRRFLLRLRDAAWLSRADLLRALTPLLAEFRARGGAIEYA